MSKFSKRAKFLSILAAASTVGKTGAGATTIPDYIPPSVEAQKAAKLEKNLGFNANRNNLNVKPEEKKSFFSKIGSYMYHHPFKTIGWGILGAAGTDITIRAVNEYVRLSAIYKQLDKEFETGMNSSSVKEYEYRFKDKNGKTTKTLIVKAIRRFSLGSIIDFESEKLAYKEIPNLKNEHLAKIIDYHYGLTHVYVVYEKVENSDWKQYWRNKMQSENWDDNKRLEWLKDVCNQIVDVALDLYDKGFYHGDPNMNNFNILDVNDKPFVKFFDFGRFYKKKQKYSMSFFSMLVPKNPSMDLAQINSSVINLYIRFFLGQEMNFSKDEEIKYVQRMINRLLEKNRWVTFEELPSSVLNGIDKKLGIDEKLGKRMDDRDSNIEEVTQKFSYIKQMREFVEQRANENKLLTNEEFKQALENFKKGLNGEKPEHQEKK